MIGRVNAGVIEVLCCLGCKLPLECLDPIVDGSSGNYTCPMCQKKFQETEKCWQTLKSYHFSVGDSANGPIGFCARVFATTEQRAVEVLRETLPDEHEMGNSGHSELDYLSIYFNGERVSTKNIDERESVMIGDLNSAQLKMLNINIETLT